jgi:hypothetical protein
LPYLITAVCPVEARKEAEPVVIIPRETPGFIRVTQLTKRFAEATAINGISFGIARGELFGFPQWGGPGAVMTDLSQVQRSAVVSAVTLIATVSTFLGLYIAVSVSEIFEAQTFSNFFRFPMIFLCGLLFPIEALPVLLRPISYLLPLTYGVDILHGAMQPNNMLLLSLDFAVIGMFCVTRFFISVRNIQTKWVV